MIAKTCLKDCLTTIRELSCYDDEFYFRNPARITAINESIQEVEKSEKILAAWPDIKVFLEAIVKYYDDGCHDILIVDAQHFLNITKPKP